MIGNGRASRWRIALGAGFGLALAVPAQAVDPCVSSCATVSVGSAAGIPGSRVTIPVSFAQGPNDGVAGQGIDEIAAVAMTIGIPGTPSGTPLVLANCTDSDGDGLPDAVRVDPAIRSTFRVVVENWECTGRNRCLCPGSGQARDNFVNLVVYGPRDLPQEGPVDIPVLPGQPGQPAQLVSIALRIAGSAEEGPIPLHVFLDSDDQQELPKPQFGAFCTAGDQAAMEQATNRDADVSRVRVEDGTVTVGSIGCVGDCNGDEDVTVDELVLGVNTVLEGSDEDCPAFDRNEDDTVSVDEVVAGVNNAIEGCP
jgi:hypothetical protein